MTKGNLKQRRAAIKCKDYKPLPGKATCQHYDNGGACKRDDYFMCIEWVRKNPDAAIPQRSETEPCPKRAPEPEPPVVEQNTVAPAKATGPEKAVYDMMPASTQMAKRAIVSTPELLTQQAVASLAATGVEATLKTADGESITLVPAYTDKDRPELSYEHARVLVVVMQVLPGTILESVDRPAKAS